MKWVNFLHFYQPASQQKEILEAVANQCYRPLLNGLLAKDRARLTINISGSLLELLDKYNLSDVIDTVGKLYASGKIEITSTACYHAFLPLMGEKEIIRQIDLNNDLVRKYVASDVVFKGFFPPEMAINKLLLDVVSKSGYSYILVDCIAYKGQSDTLDSLNGLKTFKYMSSDLVVFFRDRKPSNIIMGGIERNSANIHGLLSEYSDRKYLVTAMDGETFGHHRPGLENSLLDIYDYKMPVTDKEVQFATFNDLLALGLEEISVELQESTWASSLEDIDQGIQFISWNDPANVVHQYQWELVNLMLRVVDSLAKRPELYPTARNMADKAVASDQFFWACAKPWWSVEMIESGAYQCLETIELADDSYAAEKSRAQFLYRKIISTAFDWQRSGKIREMNKERNVAQRIPFKTRTLEAGGVEPAIYRAFIDLLKQQEAKSASAGEYEKAILWRDAVHKIETKNDIYDAIHAVDLLRLELPEERITKVLDEYTAEYRRLRGGQPEQRSN